MSLGHTKIPYLTALWHPTTGCSYGCPTCWARALVVNRLAGTMKGLPLAPPHGCSARQPDGRLSPCDGDECPLDCRYELPAGQKMSEVRPDPFAPTFHPDRLADPLKARKPQVIGVSVLGDLFDAGITDEQIAAVFGVMAAAPQHTFVVLTKQAERMERWFAWAKEWKNFLAQMTVDQLYAVGFDTGCGSAFDWDSPIPNVWLGVSVTCQADADVRIPHLLRSPAAHRWVSAEPLMGPVEIMGRHFVGAIGTLDLVIAGGESGPGARPCHPDWARSLRDQCAAAGVPFNWKQWGEWFPTFATDSKPTGSVRQGHTEGDQHWWLVGAKASGRLLDGVLHDALPWRAPRPLAAGEGDGR